MEIRPLGFPQRVPTSGGARPLFAVDELCPIAFESSRVALDLGVPTFESSMVEPTASAPMMSGLFVAVGCALVRLSCETVAFGTRVHTVEGTGQRL